MTAKAHSLSVYNTLTGKYEDIAVTKEVYEVFTRTGWNIKDNNEAFFKHEIQFSSLTGGEETSYENFREFVSFESDPLELVSSQLEIEQLSRLLGELPLQDKKLVKALFFDGQSERDYAASAGVSKTFTARRKKKIIDRLKKDSVFKK